MHTKNISRKNQSAHLDIQLKKLKKNRKCGKKNFALFNKGQNYTKK